MPPSLTPEQREAVILRLAYLDWAMTPLQNILDELPISTYMITQMRREQEYKTQFEELCKAWKERMFAMPTTSDLRKRISDNMRLAVTRLGEILGTPRATAKDLIAAARLTAQMDGRFITIDPGDREPTADQESLASELIHALKRSEQKVQ